MFDFICSPATGAVGYSSFKARCALNGEFFPFFFVACVRRVGWSRGKRFNRNPCQTELHSSIKRWLDRQWHYLKTRKRERERGWQLEIKRLILILRHEINGRRSYHVIRQCQSTQECDIQFCFFMNSLLLDFHPNFLTSRKRFHSCTRTPEEFQPTRAACL